MKFIEHRSWGNDFSCAELFAILNEHQYPRLVVRFWSQMCDHSADGDSAAWAEAGRALINLGKRGQARQLFQHWRDRRGVQMWSLANYLQCLSRFRKHDLDEVIVTCKDALTDLPHDHCARYLAVMQAEAYALIRDENGLLALWNDRRRYFDRDLQPGEYFKTDYKYLLTDIPELAEALQRNDQKSYRKTLRRIRFQRFWNQKRRKNALKLARILLQLLILLLFIGLINVVFTK